MGSCRQKGWVVSGYTKLSHEGTIENVPMTHIEIGHVATLNKLGRPLYDKILTVDFVGNPDSENRGQVEYMEGGHMEDIWVYDSSVTIGDYKYRQTNVPQASFDLSGSPQGVNRSRIKDIAQRVYDYGWKTNDGRHLNFWQKRTLTLINGSRLLNTVHSKEVAREIPQAIGYFIKQLPPKEEFTLARVGDPTRDEVSRILEANK